MSENEFRKKSGLKLILLTLCMIFMCSVTVSAATKNGLAQESGKLRYYQNGVAVKNTWEKVKSKHYYFDKHGNAVKGLKKIKGYYYYFDNNCVRKNKVLKKISGKYYYFQSDGKAATGVVKVKGKLWKFSSKGVRQSSASKKIQKAAKSGKDYSKLAKLIGKAKKVSRSSSCMGPGKDGIYQYSNFKVYTYEVKGKKTIQYIG